MIRKLYILCVCAVGLLSGCMMDDGECRIPVSLSFVYERHNYSGDRFADEVEYLHVYIYGAGGELVLVQDVAQSSLTDGNTLRFNIDPGRYTAVAWGNLHSGHFVGNGTEYISRFTLDIDCVDDNGQLSSAEPGTLFHGSAQLEAVPGQANATTVNMMNNSRYINVHIKGTQDAVIETFITGANVHYTSDNTIHSGAFPVTYISARQPESNYILERFQVYRLFKDDADIAVRVVTTRASSRGMEFECNEPLIPVLVENLPEGTDLQDYLDRRDVHDIYLLFAADGSVSASLVKPWDDIDGGIDL